MTLPRLSLCTAMVLAALSTLNAQSVATTPVGAMTYSFPATTATTTSYISIPLTNGAVYTGPVSSFTGNTISFAGTPFTASGFTQAGNPFFARVVTGAQAGRVMLVTANTNSTITLDTNDNSGQTTALNTNGWTIANGDRVEIVVGDTLSDIFGDGSSNNPLKLTGSTSALFADTVGVYNKSTGKLDNYFYSTTSGYWRSTAVNINANGLTLYPEASINITRRSGRPALSLTVTGSVPTTPSLIKVTGGSTTVYTGSRLPVDTTLSALNYANWVKNNSALFADSINIYNQSTGKFDVYFQRADNSQWNLVGGGTTDRSNISIPAGSAFTITKRGTISGSSSMLFTPLPYSL